MVTLGSTGLVVMQTPLLAEELKTYIDYARSEVNEAQLTATQRLQIEKNLLESQQNYGNLQVAVLKNEPTRSCTPI